jgi:hypothetical protein
MSDPKDRRKHPRAEARLSAGVTPAGAGELLAVTTLNVGEGGVYVEVGHFIEPLTKLSVTLDLPGPRGATRIETEAIVVRTQPEQEQPGTDRYQIACAFLSLSDPDRSLIRQWVAAQRTHAPSRN